jgi:prolyl oligopeptidase family protein
MSERDPVLPWGEAMFRAYERRPTPAADGVADAAALAALVRQEAARDGVTETAYRERLEEAGVAKTVRRLLAAGALRVNEAAALLGRPWSQVYRDALAEGVISQDPDWAVEARGDVSRTVERIRGSARLRVQTVSYSSGFDGTAPLLMEVGFDPSLQAMPILVLMHGGYPGTRLPMLRTLEHYASKGLFCVVPSLRGRDGSAGRPDSYGVEVHDIHDAVEQAKRAFPTRVDPTNVNIWGGSAGGADVIYAIQRFPDYFRIGVSFYGLDDLAEYVTLPWWMGEWDDPESVAAAKALVQRFVDDVGATPEAAIDRYLTRDMTLGFVNNPYTEVWCFWDEEEHQSPGAERVGASFAAQAASLGYANVHLRRSIRGDLFRWHHWRVSDHRWADRYFLARMLQGTVPSPMLADTGRLVVAGYLRTRRFAVALGDGTDALARMDYELSPNFLQFWFRRLSRDPRAQGWLEIPEVARGGWRITRDRAEVRVDGDAGARIPIQLDSRVQCLRES